MSVDHVPWLLHLLHDQCSLGGVPLFPERCLDGDAGTLAMAGGEESATAKSAISWDSASPAWVAGGRVLKLEEVSPRAAAALGVDKGAWLALRHAEKKELAYKPLLHWLQDDQ